MELPTPESVPSGLTRPSSRYRRLSALVSLCLIGFAGFYLGLMMLLVYDLRLTWVQSQIDGDRATVGPPFAPVALVLLAHGLWGVRRFADQPDAIEVTAQQEPALFAVIHALADRVGAPRPRKVLLVPGVNAAVTYDTSIANLVLPTQKNLLIGLGLVNALTGR